MFPCKRTRIKQEQLEHDEVCGDAPGDAVDVASGSGLDPINKAITCLKSVGSEEEMGFPAIDRARRADFEFAEAMNIIE